MKIVISIDDEDFYYMDDDKIRALVQLLIGEDLKVVESSKKNKGHRNEC